MLCEALHQVPICIKFEVNESRVQGRGTVAGSCTQPSPTSAEESPGASPHPPAGQELGSPRSFPMSHVCSLPRAQSTEEAMPSGEGSAATPSSQPVQVIVIIVTEERRGRGTPLHALQATAEGNWSAPAASRHFIITALTALKSLPALRSWELEASLPKFLFSRDGLDSIAGKDS